MNIARIATIGLLLVILAGCAADNSQPKPATSTSSTPDTTPVEVLWQADETLMSQYKVESGVAVAYVADDGNGESVLARDAETGEELWRAAASPGLNPPGVRQSIAVLEDNQATSDGGVETLVAFLSPATGSSQWTHFTVVGIADGRPTPSTSTRRLLSHRPRTCDKTFCVVAKPSGLDEMVVVGYDTSDGKLLELTGSGQPYTDGGTLIGDYISVVDPGEASETIQFGIDGKIRWERPYRSIFGAGRSTNSGWNWLDEDADMPIVGLGSPWEEPTAAGTIEQSMTDDRLVGLDRDTGETLWQIDGATSCDAAEDLTLSDGVLVACRINSGKTIQQWDGSQYTSIKHVDFEMDLIGIDVNTGELVWDVPLGTELANLYPQPDRPSFAYDSPLAWIDSAPVAVDQLTGETHELPADQILLCELSDDQVVPLASPWANGQVYDYPTSRKFAACTTTGEQLDPGQLTYRALEDAGYDTNQAVVLNLSSGVTAFAPASEG